MLWIARSTEDARDTASGLTQAGIDHAIAPVKLSSPVALDTAQLPHCDALILSSIHTEAALAALPTAWRERPVYCTGSATEALVLRHGLRAVRAPEAGIVPLMNVVRAQVPMGASLLYLSGDTIRMDIASILAPEGYRMHRRVVYRTQRAAALPAELLAHLRADKVWGIMLYSPQSAQFAGELLQEAGMACKGIHALCMSTAIADTARAHAWRTIRTSRQITDTAMLALAIDAHAATVQL